MIDCVNFKLPQNTKCVHIKDTLIRNHSFQETTNDTGQNTDCGKETMKWLVNTKDAI